jgi:hypothetical protein
MNAHPPGGVGDLSAKTVLFGLLKYEWAKPHSLNDAVDQYFSGGSFGEMFHRAGFIHACH